MNHQNPKESLPLKLAWNRISPLETRLPKVSNFIILPSDKGYHFKTPSEIIRVIADGNYCSVVTHVGEQIMLSKSLKFVQDKLDKNTFIRIHNSHLVNVQYFSFYNSKDALLLLKNGEHIPVSKSGKKTLLAWMRNC